MSVNSTARFGNMQISLWPQVQDWASDDHVTPSFSIIPRR